jgi:hypothetical protein
MVFQAELQIPLSRADDLSEAKFRLAGVRISLLNILNCKFNDVQSGIAPEDALADELSEAKFRLAGYASITAARR